MSIEPEPPPPELKDKPISLAKLATIFAVTFIVAFGLCAVSVLGSFESSKTPPLAVLALVIEVVCVIGLLAVGLMAIVRSLNK